jgi:hypothetical protein
LHFFPFFYFMLSPLHRQLVLRKSMARGCFQNDGIFLSFSVSVGFMQHGWGGLA